MAAGQQEDVVIEPGEELQTWRLPAPIFSSARAGDVRQVILRPSDAADAAGVALTHVHSRAITAVRRREM